MVGPHTVTGDGRARWGQPVSGGTMAMDVRAALERTGRCGVGAALMAILMLGAACAPVPPPPPGPTAAGVAATPPPDARAAARRDARAQLWATVTVRPEAI